MVSFKLDKGQDKDVMSRRQNLIYGENSIRKVEEKNKSGAVIGRRRMTNLRYADDSKTADKETIISIALRLTAVAIRNAALRIIADGAEHWAGQGSGGIFVKRVISGGVVSRGGVIPGYRIKDTALRTLITSKRPPPPVTRRLAISSHANKG